MAKGSGRTRGGLQVGDAFGSDVKASNIETIKNIRNGEVYRAVASAISRFHAVLGVRTREVKLASLDKAGTAGITANVMIDGELKLAVLLNKRIFNSPKTSVSSVASWAKDGYKSGWLTVTNKPVAHVVTHELAHALWSEDYDDLMARAAGIEIKALYKKFLRDRTKKGYGVYAKTRGVDEFFAEVATKAVHGTEDKYTREIKRIVKDYQL